MAFMDVLFLTAKDRYRGYKVLIPVSSVALAGGFTLTAYGNRYNRRLKLIRRELEYRGIDPGRVIRR